MISPDELQARLQKWADNFTNRNRAAEVLSAELECALGTARAYIDYRLPRATYGDAYRVWQFLSQQPEWM